MFGLYHQEAARKKVKFILSLFSHKFFFNKSVLDIGAGNGEIGASLFKMGASVTALDANQEYLKAINKKFPQIKTVRQDLDLDTKINNKFDIIFHIATLNHLNKWEDHLNSVCKMTNDVLVLETSVCDSDDPEINFEVTEDVNLIGGSYNKIGNRTSANRIEKILRENGISYYRLDVPELNYQKNIYNWKVENTGRKDYFLRRFWICSKRTAIIEQLRKKYYKPIEKVLLDLDETEAPLNKEDEVAETYHLAEPAPVLNNANLTSTIQPAKEIKIVKIEERISSLENKKFVIVIPSYKNERWAEKNILSVLDQNYDNFRVIFTDDCSPDSTFEVTKKVVENHRNRNKCTLIHNKSRKGALENLYDMIYSCEDDEIIVTLDGDDWLSGREVLHKLNKYYQDDNVWMSYGQYTCHPNGDGHCKQIPNSVIESNNFRQSTWLSSHLRTFYTWLFKQIKKEDLMYEGKFAPSAWDMYIMFPMLEMAGEKSKFINDVLYVYNLENPINDHKVDKGLQSRLDNVCRQKKKYNKITKKPQSTLKDIGLLLIATNKYEKFIQTLIESADKYFFNSANYNVKYFIFTDSSIKPVTSRDYQIIPTEHRKFPYASMDRFKHFTNHSQALSQVDYLYYVDVDCKFVDTVSTEILGNLVGVRHCGFFNGGGTFETNKSSIFYSDNNKYKYYFGGGFSGGRAEKYLKLSKWCYEAIEKDLSNGIMPIYHDETAINKYFLDNEPDVVLSPSYHYPESNLNFYLEKWKPYKFNPKILLLDKDHEKVRG